MPNTQTSVPAFTAGQVLTAAQMTEVNTGIPVFATTTTRDAAFGGTGEKTLAEGQYAYIEATNTTQYYDGAAWQTLGGGLTLITAQTIGSAVSSVTVSNCFSATYDNYRIMITGGSSSTNVSCLLTLGSTATGYYSALNGRSWANAAITSAAANSTSWSVGEASTNQINAVIDLCTPFLSDETSFVSLQNGISTTGYTYQAGGYLANNTSYTSFTLAPTSGTITGGTIRVYGYQNS